MLRINRRASRLFFLFFLFAQVVFSSSFLDAQRKFERFRLAEKEKLSFVKEMLAAHGLTLDSIEVFIRVFKREGVLEVWARNENGSPFMLVRTYEVCSASGDLGPKRRMGDGQVPEGFYRIDRFNPVSSFHMSLGLDYPNASDRILSDRRNPGGDIFIHGNCVTIGCVPIQDRFIQEVYLLCAYARSAGQKEIPVHLFPTRLDSTGMAFLKKNHPDPVLQKFWGNLKPIYDLFEAKKLPPRITVGREGLYKVTTPMKDGY
jgi:murein L,D-transpeptidase YafK